MTFELPAIHHALLVQCAGRLGISSQEALEQAVARLHLALFDEGAAPEDVDFERSMPEPNGLDVTTKSILDPSE